MTAQNARLEAAILAKPEEVNAWSIYGDWLQAEGDPRGEWVGLMVAREGSPTAGLAKAERAFFEANQQWLLGPALSKSLDCLVWRRGFLAAAQVDTTEGLRELLEHPSARFLEQVTLAPASDELADAWSPLIAGAGWKSVRVQNAKNAAAVFGLPKLTEAVIDLRYREPVGLDPSGALT
ncbi:MAG: hypothetical protein H6Q89_2651, partial [Myxococcaceae bacterium]|nr:hypothetical protein [Myxococcaceae bacterium]